MSQFTPEQEKEFEFRLRYEQEQAAKEAPAQQAASNQEQIEKAKMAGLPIGAVAGAGTQLAGKVADIGRMMGGGEYVPPGFYGRGAHPVERYGRQQNIAGKWLGGGSYEQAAERIAKAFPVGGPITGDAAIIAQLEKEALGQMPPVRRTAERIATSVPTPVRGLLTSPFGFIGKTLGGAGAGMQAGEAAGRYSTGDTPGAVISGLGALGSAAAMIPHPIARIGGTALSLGAEGLNAYLDSLKKKNQAPKQMAEGGSAKKKMSKAERAAKAIENNNKKKVPHLANGGGDLPPPENAARTQIIGTLPTYEKAAEELRKRGAQGRAIDFGAGLGEGAKILKADTYEPFPKGWKPTFIDPKQIPTEAYGKLTNLNVMNVVPPKIRDEIASHIGRVIEPGGQGIVTTRGADVMKAKGKPGPEPMSIITSRDTYQKGFTKQELEDYMKRMLGEKYDVSKVNLGPAGVHVQKKKPTIYTGGGIAIPVNAPVGSRAQETTGQGAAQIMNPLNLNFKEGGQVGHYFLGGSVSGTGPTIGAVETPPVKFGMESPNPNPYGFTAPTGPASQALVPYYNKVTGESWTAPSGGYTPPSADWFQGSPGNLPVAPLPSFAPGMDPVTPYMPQRAPNMIATEDPEFYKRAAEEVRLNSMPPRAPTGGIITEAPPSQSLLNEIRGVTTPPTNPIGSGLNSLVQTNAPKPVASITQQQPFQQRRVAPPLRGTMNLPIKPRALPYTPKPIPKPMPRRRMFAEGGSTTPAWQRSEGKNPEGGLNAVGRASYNRETGGNLKAPQPEGGSRKKSFCARMGGMKKKLTSSKTANDPDSRINKALRKWKC